MSSEVRFSSLMQQLGLIGLVRFSQIVQISNGTQLTPGANKRLTHVKQDVQTYANSSSTTYINTISGLTTPYNVYSTLLLISTYAGPVFRLRRANDNTEAAVYMTNNGLVSKIDTFNNAADTTVRSTLTGISSLSTWLSGTNGYVTTWYDQTTTGFNLTQSNTSKQPLYDVTNNMAFFESSRASSMSYGRMMSISNYTFIIDIVPITHTTLSTNAWYIQEPIIFGELGGATHDWGLVMSGTPSFFGVGSGPLDAATTMVATNGINTKSIMGARRIASTGVVTLYRDGTSRLTATRDTGTKNAPNPTIFGSGVANLNAKIKTFIYFNTGLTDAQVTQVSTLLTTPTVISPTATNVRTTSLQLNWSGAFTNMIITWNSGLSTSGSQSGVTYSVTGLTPNTSYTFTFTPYIGVTAGTPTTLTVTTAASASISNLVAAAYSASSINISWTSQTEDYTIVTWDGNSSGSVNTNSYLATNLVENQTYTFTATPYSSTGTSGTPLTITTTLTYVPVPTGARLSCQAKNLSLANGAAVSSWDGLVQNTASRRPVYYTTGGFANRSYLQFTASSSQFLHSPDASPITMSCATGGGYTMSVLVRFRASSPDWSRVLQGHPSTSLSEDFMTLNKVGNTFQIATRYGASGYITPSAAAFSYVAGTWYVISVRVSPSGCDFRVNNTTIGTAAGAALNDILLHLGLGCNIYGNLPSVGNSGNFANIDVAALFIYDRRLSDSELTVLYNYLNGGNA